ncbi:hypothetical protein ASE00_02785 [Sphingomonas sp. Root710]|nr:hypothetical protein ASE00_02785 [Sphingomonas sp. Root710]
MASRWRRRRLCELRADGLSQMVALRDISGSGARLETGNPPALGSQVELIHPDAGSISGRVTELSQRDIRISFDVSERTIAFALNAIAADMTRG